MGRLDNLKPFNTLSAEQRHELAVKGGKARAEQRRQQRREIDRLKAEEIAKREADKEGIYALKATVDKLYAAALLNGMIEKPKRHRDGLRWKSPRSTY